MSYKKITVDGQEHQYTVGKTHVKVRGMEAALKETVGKHREYDPRSDGGQGDPMSALFPELPLPTKLSVTPADIADFIRANG